MKKYEVEFIACDGDGVLCVIVDMINEFDDEIEETISVDIPYPDEAWCYGLPENEWDGMDDYEINRYKKEHDLDYGDIEKMDEEYVYPQLRNLLINKLEDNGIDTNKVDFSQWDQMYDYSDNREYKYF